MSIHYLSKVWEDLSVTRQSHLLVLLAIADYARADGKAWPSIDSLAQKSRLSQRSVQNVIAELISAKKLSVERGAGPFGTNVYSLIDGGVQTLHPANDDPIQGPIQGRQIAPNPSGTVRNGQESSSLTRHTGQRRPASVEEVVAKGQMIGLPEQDCRNWFRDSEACGWRRGDGTLFDNWPRQLCIYRDQLRKQPPSTNSYGPKSSSPPNRNAGTYNSGDGKNIRAMQDKRDAEWDAKLRARDKDVR